MGSHCSGSHVRHSLCRLDPAEPRKIGTDGAGRGGAGRWCVTLASLFPHLSAVDGPGAGGRWHLRAAAVLERTSLSVPAPLLATKLDRCRGSGAVLGRRRSAMELYDGASHRLFVAAARDLFGAEPLRGSRPERVEHEQGPAPIGRLAHSCCARVLMRLLTPIELRGFNFEA